TIFFPRSISFDLVEIQRELNAYESLIKLHAMTSAVEPILQDISTIVSEITGRSDLEVNRQHDCKPVTLMMAFTNSGITFTVNSKTSQWLSMPSGASRKVQLRPPLPSSNSAPKRN